MKKLLMLALCMLLALSVCVPATAEEGQTVYRSLYSGEITSLNYLTTSTTNEFTIAANVIDTLIERDPFGDYVPCLAESWETSEDGTTWTFHLRKDAKWLTYQGEVYADVTANDFITSAKYLLDAANASSTSWILTDYILNAEAYYDYTNGEGEAIAFDEVGIKAPDDYTIVYTTTEPCPFFLSMLDYVCYMPVNAKFLEEKGADFGLATGPDTLLYCGPYILSEFAPQEKRVYTKNAMNWDAEHVYIDVIEQTYNKEAGTLSPELYSRGEVDDADITSTIAAEWLADPEKADLIHPVRQYWQYSYFWTFNFDAQFEEDYEPENWLKAVNNEAFRQSIRYALDRLKAKIVIEPENPEDLLSDTIMPRDICVLDGVDYTTMGALENIAFDMDAETALAYKQQAVEELTQAGATFPIKILLTYNVSSSSWAEESIVVKQQLESVLGTDYIDVMVEGRPNSGFLRDVRRSGKYAFMKCNWGLDFDDPVNLTEPFKETNNYNFFIKATDPALMNEQGTLAYYDLLHAAKDMSAGDMKARYEAFAEAEAYLINHAIVIPFGSNTGGYTASRLNPFEGQFGATGLASCRYKGQHLLEKPMSTDEYYDAYDAWLEQRDALAAK